jgi:hypothetical protein
VDGRRVAAADEQPAQALHQRRRGRDEHGARGLARVQSQPLVVAVKVAAKVGVVEGREGLEERGAVLVLLQREETLRGQLECRDEVRQVRGRHRG